MKSKIKNKKLVIGCIIVIIILAVAIITGIYVYNKTKNTTDDSTNDKAYIEIWRDITMDADIDLYSTGSGENEKLYLGAQPLQYRINKNGEIYTYQESSFKNMTTGERDPATSNYIKTISQSEVEKIESELKSIIENNTSDSYDYGSTYWYIKMNEEVNRVNVNVYQYVLEQYVDENYEQTVKARNLEKSIHDFMKENYATNKSSSKSEAFDMLSLTDEEKNIILEAYKKENPDIEFENSELLDIIEQQSIIIWSENLKDSI